MVLNPQVKLPPDWIERSREWGARVVTDYASGWNAKSRAVSCFDAERNIVLQSKAKMCECAFALWAGIDPQRLHWERYCDDGADVTWLGKRWDVKATGINSRFLIWPIAKNHIFESKRFDNLVLVKHDEPSFVISGWISKEEFRANHQVAGAGHKLFPGTWYMDQIQLWGPWLLKEVA